jgi:Tfp pilus assembly protein PilZ
LETRFSMGYKGKEKRICIRFQVPGATLDYKKRGFFSASFDYEDNCLPILDLSRGGLRFLSNHDLRINTKLHLRIAIPEQEELLYLDGKVRWTRPNAGFSYKFQIGVQFNPYGLKEGQNSPAALTMLESLEEKSKEEETP